MRESLGLTLRSTIITHAWLLADQKTLHTLKVALFMELSHHSLRFQNTYVISQSRVSNGAQASHMLVITLFEEAGAAETLVLPVSRFNEPFYLLVDLILI